GIATMAAVTKNNSPRMTGSGLSTSMRSRASGTSARSHRSIRLVRNAVTAYAATRARASARLSSGQFEGIGEAILPGRGSGDLDLQIRAASLTNHTDRGGAADPRIGDEAREVSGVLNRRAVERHDHVDWLQAALRRGRIPTELVDQRALGIRQLQFVGDAGGDRDDLNRSDGAAPDLLELLQVVHDTLGEVAGDREAN